MAACLCSIPAPAKRPLLLILFLLLILVVATASASDIPSGSSLSPANQSLRSILPLRRYLARVPVLGGVVSRFTAWDMVTVLATCCGLFRLWRWRKDRGAGTQKSSEGGNSFRARSSEDGRATGATATDPGLLKKYSVYKPYTTSFATYPKIRLFVRPHAHADKLPNKPKPLPLLVFVHGLGGSIAQFNNILTSLVNVGPCLGIDLPGCGLSQFSPPDWEAYSHPALVELIGVIISDICTQTETQEVVLIGHSMGCSLAVSQTSMTSPLASKIRDRVVGLVAICPQASSPSAKRIRLFRRLLSIPTPIFNVWRTWDRRGGPESASVARFVGANAHPETKKLQVRFNEQSQTDVWRRMAWGAIPSVDANGRLDGGLPGLKVWAGVRCPLFLIAGEGDHVTKAEELEVICKALRKDDSQIETARQRTENATRPAAISTQNCDGASDEQQRSGSKSTSMTAVESIDPSSGDNIASKKSAAFKMSTLPAPAGHALLYDHATYRTLSGLIQSFLSTHIDSRLSLGWQLQHLKDANKWDVKNLAKWQSVSPASEPIAGVFRAMKTLREVDDVHSPETFVKNWGDKIRAVIDISHDTPVYNPQTLDDGGIEYHKFPTVSKIPPTPEEVCGFILLVDGLRLEAGDDKRLIGVHCHYGFNRTGFFICSYLIEKLGYSIPQATDEFEAQRPPGIRHNHFLDTLAVRYHKGLRRVPTL